VESLTNHSAKVKKTELKAIPDTMGQAKLISLDKSSSCHERLRIAHLGTNLDKESQATVTVCLALSLYLVTATPKKDYCV